MIFTLGKNGEIVFDLHNQSPWDWIECMTECFPNDWWSIGCYGQYENCLYPLL